MNAIIIEDEAVAARRLKKIAEENGLSIVAVLHTVQDSVQWFSTNPHPELIFLDIRLSDGLCFEIFEKILPKSAVIFTTAYDEYALKAFKLNSIDYLLKPIQKEEVRRAIEKFRNTLNTALEIDAERLKALLLLQPENSFKERFLVQVGTEFKSIETSEIALFYSQDKASYMLVHGRNYLADESLEKLSKRLNPKDFFRISRQAIVHLPYIEKIYSYSGSRLKVKIKESEQDFLVSRERTQEFKNWLQR